MGKTVATSWSSFRWRTAKLDTPMARHRPSAYRDSSPRQASRRFFRASGGLSEVPSGAADKTRGGGTMSEAGLR